MHGSMGGGRKPGISRPRRANPGASRLPDRPRPTSFERGEGQGRDSLTYPAVGCQVPPGRGGRWEGGCGVARGRPGLLWSAAPRSGCVWAGDEMFDGVIPLGAGGCGRSIFLGGPRAWRVGSESSGAGRGDICVSEGLPCAGGLVVGDAWPAGRHSLRCSAAEARVKRPRRLHAGWLSSARGCEGCRLTRGARLRYLARAVAARRVALARHRRARAACDSSA